MSILFMKMAKYINLILKMRFKVILSKLSQEKKVKFLVLRYLLINNG